MGFVPAGAFAVAAIASAADQKTAGEGILRTDCEAERK
jgi:hypothetical protein